MEKVSGIVQERKNVGWTGLIIGIVLVDTIEIGRPPPLLDGEDLAGNIGDGVGTEEHLAIMLGTGEIPAGGNRKEPQERCHELIKIPRNPEDPVIEIVVTENGVKEFIDGAGADVYAGRTGKMSRSVNGNGRICDSIHFMSCIWFHTMDNTYASIAALASHIPGTSLA